MLHNYKVLSEAVSSLSRDPLPRDPLALPFFADLSREAVDLPSY